MILIAGGAGYIGSHTNKILFQNGYETLVYDNLIYGHQEAVKWGEFVRGDLNSIDYLRSLFLKHKIDAVMHLAAFAYVGESVENPEKYYLNNVSATLNLLRVMREFNCNYLIFSSSCAIYGNPKYSPIDEKHPKNPINPYGRGKLMVERILQDYAFAYGLKYVSLRYFNAAGADIETEIGEDHDPETHLIPLVLDAAMGKREDIKVFGTDYDTPDSTAIRDYIHVTDLAQAHVLALEYLRNDGVSNVFNLANGDGYSVLEVIKTAKEVTNKDFKVTYVPRRAGDPAKLVGDSTKAKTMLRWEPEFFNLKTIIKSAWKWHERRNHV